MSLAVSRNFVCIFFFFKLYVLLFRSLLQIFILYHGDIQHHTHLGFSLDRDIRYFPACYIYIRVVPLSFFSPPIAMDIIVSPNRKPYSAMDTIASSNKKPNSVIDTIASASKKPNSEIKQTSFDDLSNDLLLEILHRLPLKPAHRFKCISKRWGYLISQPQFAQRFIQRMKLLFPSQSPPFSLFFQCYSPEPFPIEFKQFHRDSNFRSSNFFFNFLPPNPKPTIYLGSSNGLVLCSTTIWYQKDYYVCNPLTGSWVFLPWPHYFDKHVLAGFICYASYDDIDTINTQFKVVRVTPGGINQVRTDHGSHGRLKFFFFFLNVINV